jgi:hypothetical protein
MIRGYFLAQIGGAAFDRFAIRRPISAARPTRSLTDTETLVNEMTTEQALTMTLDPVA